MPQLQHSRISPDRWLALTLTILVSAIAIPLTVSAEDRDYDQPYTLASLDGEFALVGTYTGGIARQLGVVHAKDGAVTGYLRVNAPGTTALERVVVYISFAGTATIADDGSGVIALSKVTYPDGSLHTATIDFLITKADQSKGNNAATEIATMQRETPALSPGALIVGTLTRRLH